MLCDFTMEGEESKASPVGSSLKKDGELQRLERRWQSGIWRQLVSQASLIC